MILHKKLVYSFTFALIIFFISLGLNIIPCQTAPNIPNPKYTWTLCTLNPDIHIQNQLENKYFGSTTSLTESYIIVLVSVFILAFVILSIVLRKKQ